MTHEDGFLTLFSIDKGWRHKYTQLKWLWISVSALCGMTLGVLSWFYFPELVMPACITGAVLGAGIFFLVLKSLPDNAGHKRD